MKFLDFWVVEWKLTKLLMSYLKLQASFSLKFASLFNVMRGNSSVIFVAETLYNFYKKTHQSAKFHTLGCSDQFSPNLYYDRVLLLKVSKISVKKVPRSYVLWSSRVRHNLKKKQFVNSKFTRFWWILIRAPYQNSTLIGPFPAKYKTLELKRYIGVIFDDTFMTIWEETYLWLEK